MKTIGIISRAAGKIKDNNNAGHKETIPIGKGHNRLVNTGIAQIGKDRAVLLIIAASSGEKAIMVKTGGAAIAMKGKTMAGIAMEMMISVISIDCVMKIRMPG